MITLITGGSGSGKSAYAEKYICHVSHEKGYKEKYYIATMQVFDDEGQRKIDRHRRLRAGKGFITIEQPRDIQNAISKLQSESCLKTGRSALLECMSNLVANEMFPPVDASGMQAAEAEKEALDDPENMKDYDIFLLDTRSIKPHHNHYNIVCLQVLEHNLTWYFYAYEL